MFISIFSPVTRFYMSVAQVCFLGAICKLLWQRIPEQFVKLMEVFSFNYSQKDLKINTYSKYFLNVSHRMNHFKWQMQHSESRDSQCSFTKWELQTADDISSDGVSRSWGDYSNFTRRRRNQPLFIKILHKYWWKHIIVRIRIKLAKISFIYSHIQDSKECYRMHIKKERLETQKIWIKQERCSKLGSKAPYTKAYCRLHTSLLWWNPNALSLSF